MELKEFSDRTISVLHNVAFHSKEASGDCACSEDNEQRYAGSMRAFEVCRDKTLTELYDVFEEACEYKRTLWDETGDKLTPECWWVYNYYMEIELIVNMVIAYHIVLGIDYEVRYKNFPSPDTLDLVREILEY